jgi:hypothetical protein
VCVSVLTKEQARTNASTALLLLFCTVALLLMLVDPLNLAVIYIFHIDPVLGKEKMHDCSTCSELVARNRKHNDRDITTYYHYNTQTESKPVCVQFVRDSKRFVPEAVNVVAGLLDRFASANGVAASASLCAQSIPTLAHMPDDVLQLNRAAAAKKCGARNDAKVNLWAAWGLEGVRLDPHPNTHTYTRRKTILVRDTSGSCFIGSASVGWARAKQAVGLGQDRRKFDSICAPCKL